MKAALAAAPCGRVAAFAVEGAGGAIAVAGRWRQMGCQFTGEELTSAWGKTAPELRGRRQR